MQIADSRATAPTPTPSKLVKSAPAGQDRAVTRTYTITPTGGSGYTATVRLHYLDSELNGNTESALELWRAATGAGPLTSQGQDARDTTNNCVPKGSVTAANFSGVWTLAIAATFTVTFDANGGTGSMAQPDEPLRRRRQPDGQRLHPDGLHLQRLEHGRQRLGHSLRGRRATPSRQRHPVRPVDDRPDHTVTFDANGGTGSMAAQTRNYADAANLTANAFTRTGYSFGGWNTAANGSGTSLRRRGELPLHRRRHPVRPVDDRPDHTVTFDANGGTGTMAPRRATTATPPT